MLVSTLIVIFSMLPICLGIGLYMLYRKSKSVMAIAFFLTSVSLWQLDVAVLYMVDFLSEETIFSLFKLFRAGHTYGFFFMILITYYVVSENNLIIQSKECKNKIYYIISNKIFLWFTFLFSTFVYIIGFTPLGIEGVTLKHMWGTSYYYPNYGFMNIAFILISLSYPLVVIFLFFISRDIQSKSVRHFIQIFTISSFLLFVGGMLNVALPDIGAIISGLSVLLFSLIIMFAFIKMHLDLIDNYNRMMEKQSKLDYIGTISSSLIHEVNNSITLIKGYTNLMEHKKINEENRGKVISNLKSSTNHLEEVVSNFYKYIEHEEIQFEFYNVIQILHQSVELSEKLLSDNQVQISVESNYEELNVYLNRTYMTQVFLNLIKNSVESFHPSSNNKEITVHINLVDEWIELYITDNGEGIAETEWDKIFNPFKTHKSSGKGMGLAFCKKTMLEHNGDIVVNSSQVNKGTTFKLTFPQTIYYSIPNKKPLN